MISHDRPILMIGCGHLGRALVRGWCQSFITPSHIHALVSSEESAQALALETDIHTYGALDDIPDIIPAIVIIAVKPQQIDDVLPSICDRWNDPSIPYASLAAGTLLSHFETALSAKHSIIRIMPNVACQIGRSMTACIENLHCQFAHKELVHQLMSSVGHVAWLDKEEDMHAATAIAGSAPAFVYYMAECLVNAAQKAGLSPKLSQDLVMHMMAGSGMLAEQSEINFSQLRESIARKGGTTEAGVAVLENGLGTLISEAVQSSAKRSKALSES